MVLIGYASAQSTFRDSGFRKQNATNHHVISSKFEKKTAFAVLKNVLDMYSLNVYMFCHWQNVVTSGCTRSST